MSYLNWLKSQAEQYDIPYTIFREMNARMDTICNICWTQTDATRYEMVRKFLWDKEDGMELLNRVNDSNSGFYFQELYFRQSCVNNDYKMEHIDSFLDFWREL